MQSQQRFNRFMNLAIDAQVEASLCGGKDRKQFMRVAQIYCEMAISMPRARREVATPNANGATEGAVASNYFPAQNSVFSPLGSNSAAQSKARRR